MPAFTGVFHFPFPVRGDSAKLIPGQIQTLAEQVDAALAQRAVAPDLETAAALATRATNLETRATALETRATALETPTVTAVPLDASLYVSHPAAPCKVVAQRNGMVGLQGAFTNGVTPFSAGALATFNFGTLAAAHRPTTLKRFKVYGTTPSAGNTVDIIVNPSGQLSYYSYAALAAGFVIDLSACWWQLGI